MSPNSAVSIILTPLYESGNLSVSVSAASLLYFIHSVKRTDINFTSARTIIGIKESISNCSIFFILWYGSVLCPRNVKSKGKNTFASHAKQMRHQ